jgi:hypothetical protein
MSKFARKSARRGRHGVPQEAAPLLARTPAAWVLHLTATALGFGLTGSVRPYLRDDGLTSVRFVWRRRDAGCTRSLTYTATFRS